MPGGEAEHSHNNSDVQTQQCTRYSRTVHLKGQLQLSQRSEVDAVT